MIERIAIAGYRSVRSMTIRLGQLNVITGKNGCGKSNLYRSLRLLTAVAEGDLLRLLASEGGFESVLWAGPEVVTNEMRQGEHTPMKGPRRTPVSLRLGIAATPLSYCIDLGLPTPRRSMFDDDPEVKRECIWRGAATNAPALCVDRRNSLLRCRGVEGAWQDVQLAIAGTASILTEYADPYIAPEVIVTREALRSWRFYDSFRVDADSPARSPSVQTLTPVLSNDGRDLAAAVQTIREIGHWDDVQASIEDAFPGSQLHVTKSELGMQLTLEQPGLLRELALREVSDGTLRYLLLMTALHSPRPPEFMVLNEPENSLHPDLIPALARMIRNSCARSQIVVVTHEEALVGSLVEDPRCNVIRLDKVYGETLIENSNALDQYGWTWPRR